MDRKRIGQRNQDLIKNIYNTRNDTEISKADRSSIFT